MLPMTLTEAAAATGGTLHHVPDANAHTGAPLAFDSRNVEPGSLFAALRGTNTDGHDHAHQAVLAGALAAITERPIPGTPCIVVDDVLTAMADLAHFTASRYTGIVLAITGSAGKTSTKDLLLHILEKKGPTVANMRSFNNEIGFPSTVLRVEPDTAHLVLEMGARGKGHIAHLVAIAPPSIACCLPIGSAHLGEFGSREAIAEAKREIVEQLPPTGTAVLCADDPLVASMAEHTAATVLTYGTAPTADVRADDVKLTEDGRPHFTLTWRCWSAPVELAVHGRHHVTNGLAAAALALAAGVDFDTVTTALAEATIVSGGRMEPLHRPDGTLVINDAFNASPESVIAALRSLDSMAGGRPRYAVLGEMKELGDSAAELHESVGWEAAKNGITHLVTVGGDNAQLLGLTAGKAGVAHTAHATDRDSALQLIADLLHQGDGPAVVLVKGANSLGLEHLARALANPSLATA
ncbi:UDP-N-acetylmuramoyl-tripeptide--D-alanyl-D-alanine ligase [Kitasatospora sp. NPDC057223]|uniref:UDP-N-acetylmuramoyl-tripeptide--D-alanyl-D- alanine ligase n=1 Tax=Kitasatospora sp. NPDC057223 TaxID=3346055 RepID=UPI0036367724